MKKLLKVFRNLNQDRRSKILLLIISLVVVIGFSFIACEGPEGPMGPAGKDGVDGSNGGGYKIGDAGPGGGIVFYDKGNDSGGWRYLEVAPNTIGQIPWASTNINIADTGTEIGTGKNNTQKIITAHPDDTATNNASKACVAYRGPNN